MSIAGTKKYTDINVYDAAILRFEYIFDHFEHVCVSFSGGKDSSVCTQLCAEVARSKGRKFSVLYMDLEAMFQETNRHVEEVRESIKDVCDKFYWVCLPLIEENSLSSLNPEFITWDDSCKEKWIRDIPSGAITTDNNPFPFYDGLMSFEDFHAGFGKWFSRNGRTASVVGIRTDESVRRFIAIVSEGKKTFEGQKWTTEIGPNLYNCYPIYDWKVQDIWGAVSQKGLLFNQVYQHMWMNGIPLSKQRICQPFGQAQRAGLDQFRTIEPETWERLLQRVEGVNFGAIYCRTSLLGAIKSAKPKHMTWEQYAVFLLESLGMYEPKIMARYYNKIKYYLLYEQKNLGVPYGRVPEEGTKGQGSWKNIARGLEKNDFFLTHLSFGPDKAGDKLLLELREKHKLLGDGKMPPKLEKRIKEL